MNIHQVLRYIDPETLARDTFEFVKIQSETGREGDGSRFFADLLRREGFDVTLDEIEPNRPNVYAFVKGAPTVPTTLLFNGHIDTIPIGSSAPPARRDGAGRRRQFLRERRRHADGLLRSSVRDRAL